MNFGFRELEPEGYFEVTVHFFKRFLQVWLVLSSTNAQFSLGDQWCLGINDHDCQSETGSREVVRVDVQCFVDPSIL